MKRNIYGLVQAGRVWQQHLMTWMIDKLHARLYLNDRCAFEWSHTYADAAGEQVTERLIGTIHVDDVLFTVEGERVRAEFMRLLKADFKVTGCEDEADEASKFTGIQTRRDWARQTVMLHQTVFTERLLAKHGLEGLSKVLAVEGAGKGVTSNTVCPGYVRTPLVEGQIADQARVHDLPEDRVVDEVLLARTPVKRLVEPEEVAGLVAWLCGPHAASVTGTSHVMDGGWTAT